MLPGCHGQYALLHCSHLCMLVSMQSGIQSHNLHGCGCRQSTTAHKHPIPHVTKPEGDTHQSPQHAAVSCTLLICCCAYTCAPIGCATQPNTTQTQSTHSSLLSLMCARCRIGRMDASCSQLTACHKLPGQTTWPNQLQESPGVLLMLYARHHAHTACNTCYSRPLRHHASPQPTVRAPPDLPCSFLPITTPLMPVPPPHHWSRPVPPPLLSLLQLLPPCLQQPQVVEVLSTACAWRWTLPG